MTVADRILSFNQSLEINQKLPRGVQVMNPFKDPYTRALCTQFYKRFYNDLEERKLILGINPGRHGAGTTGIPFTDPVKLQEICGISNTLPKKTELSADFIYAMIAAYGGPEKFYRKFHISSVSPLGFVKDGRNMNYYDSRELQKAVLPFIEKSLSQQASIGTTTDICFCLGHGKNYEFLVKLNESMKLFKKIIPLLHPRFILQYRRKKMKHYLAEYIKVLS